PLPGLRRRLARTRGEPDARHDHRVLGRDPRSGPLGRVAGDGAPSPAHSRVGGNDLRFGVRLPHSGPFASKAAIDAMATSAERLGYDARSEEHTSELQSREKLVCRLLLEK